MDTVLWILAAGLAVAFLGAGTMKLMRTPVQLHDAGQGWVEDYSARTIKVIGTLEVLAALALVVPPLVGVATLLVPLAATGLVLLMVGAGLTHARRREWQMVGVTGTLLVLAAVVAWGRFGPERLGG